MSDNASSLPVYVGPFADSSRWHSFVSRPDDIIITTPSKCGTTLMQNLVGTLIFGKADFGSVSEISLWFDALFRPEAETHQAIAAQTHRRFLKTHAPIDALPRPPGVTFIAVVRHPLDVAMSRFDHRANQDHGRTEQLRSQVVDGPVPPSGREQQPTEPGDFIRWWIDNDREHRGIGGLGLADLCRQAGGYWAQRHSPGLHLFHYDDLWNDLPGQLNRLASILAIPATPDQLATWAAACSFDSMRERADHTAPEAHLGLWPAPQKFFAQGGRRNWGELLTEADLDRFTARTWALADDATPWILGTWREV